MNERNDSKDLKKLDKVQKPIGQNPSKNAEFGTEIEDPNLKDNTIPGAEKAPRK